MNKTVRIALTCFAGSALFALLALAVNPRYWWLGSFSGFAGGYLGYEFRETLAAIPEAAKAALRGSKATGIFFGQSASFLWKWTKGWFARKHPFIYPGAIITSAWMAATLWSGDLWYAFTPSGYSAYLWILAFEVWILSTMLLSFLVGALANVGALWIAHVYFDECVVVQEHDKEGRDPAVTSRALRMRGYRKVTLTYTTTFQLAMLGLFLPGLIVQNAWFGVRAVLRFVGLMIYHFIRIIHSNERLLCGVDTIFGGAIGYRLLVTHEMTLVQSAILVLFCGVLGAMFGVASWEIFSKRIFKVVPVRN